jgi:hypothetical protein
MTPSNDEPTMGEILRRLDQTAAQLANIVERLERRDTYIEENFVRQRVWVEARKGDQAMVANLNQDIAVEKSERLADVKTLRDERKSDANWRRQQNLSVAILAITTLVSIALTITNLVAR